MQNIPEHEVEQFEDDPLEYVRLDLSFASSSAVSGGGLTAEGTTRRQAAADVLRALVASGCEADTTSVVLKWVEHGLEVYNSNPNGEDVWKRKDEAVFLLTSVATISTTTQVSCLQCTTMIMVPIVL